MNEQTPTIERIESKVKQLDFSAEEELLFPCCKKPLSEEEVLAIKQKIAQEFKIDELEMDARELKIDDEDLIADLAKVTLAELMVQLPIAYEQENLKNPHSFPQAVILPHQCEKTDATKKIIARLYLRNFNGKQISITTGE